MLFLYGTIENILIPVAWCVYVNISMSGSSIIAELQSVHMLALVYPTKQWPKVVVTVHSQIPNLVKCSFQLPHILSIQFSHSVDCFPQWLHQFTFLPTAYVLSHSAVSDSV